MYVWQFWLSYLCVTVDGSWGNWGQWGTCTVTCGGGRWSRSRTCDNPAPANGGLDCPGDMSDFSDCNIDACPTVAAGQYQQVCSIGDDVSSRGGEGGSYFIDYPPGPPFHPPNPYLKIYCAWLLQRCSSMFCRFQKNPFSRKSTAIPCPNNDIYVNHLFVLIKTFENILNPRAFYLKYLLRQSFVHRNIKLISIWISIFKKWLNHLYILFVTWKTIFWYSSSLFRALVCLWIIQNNWELNKKL